MDTRPKLIERDAIDRAAMAVLSPSRRTSVLTATLSPGSGACDAPRHGLLCFHAVRISPGRSNPASDGADISRRNLWTAEVPAEGATGILVEAPRFVQSSVRPDASMVALICSPMYEMAVSPHL
jgi:hypothetical protein